MQVQLQHGNNSPPISLSPNTLMNSLLTIASRVEAAVEAYGTVKPVSNLDKWRQHFNEERVSAILS